jgi:hypothetical protein
MGQNYRFSSLRYYAWIYLFLVHEVRSSDIKQLRIGHLKHFFQVGCGFFKLFEYKTAIDFIRSLVDHVFLLI